MHVTNNKLKNKFDLDDSDEKNMYDMNDIRRMESAIPLSDKSPVEPSTPNQIQKLNPFEKSNKYNCLNFRQFYEVNKHYGELGEGAESVVFKCSRLQ